MNSNSSARIVYLSHGGGPLPILGDPGHLAMIEFMKKLPSLLPKPDAVLVISAHWEEETATLQGLGHPPMLYDYFGFPPAAYEITYPAPGSPALAGRITDLLRQNRMDAQIDVQRGFDHGLFIPLSLMYPDATIPALQLSLLRSLSPNDHLALGKALQGLAADNILVLGSGFSFHNMAAFFHHNPSTITPRNEAFQDWLIETITGKMPQNEREKRLNDWESAPFARYCHPREEHLLPLHVCAGMAAQPGQLIFDDLILGFRSVAFAW